MLQDEDFTIDQTVQSQYAASEHICAVIEAFWKCLNPAADISKIYNKMINPRTAEGYGLDVWGRIVAIGREFVSAFDDNKYLGFHSPVTDMTGRIDSMNNAPFYKKVEGVVRLADTAYRNYIFIKAMINIGNSSLAFLNEMLSLLFPNKRIACLHVDTMTLRLINFSYLTAAEKTALMQLPWLPAGVKLQIYDAVSPTFGFLGSGGEPFGNGVFTPNNVIIV